MKKIFLPLFLTLLMAMTGNTGAKADTPITAVDWAKYAQKIADVVTTTSDSTHVFFYNYTQRKFISVGGWIGVKLVLDDFGSAFTIHKHETDGKYKIKTRSLRIAYGEGDAMCDYLGTTGPWENIYVDRNSVNATEDPWEFVATTVNVNGQNVTGYKMRCHDTHYVVSADVTTSEGYTYRDVNFGEEANADVIFLITRAQYIEMIKAVKSEFIDITPLLYDGHFDRNSKDRTHWVWEKPNDRGWRWNKNQQPVTDRYYHLVGVYDRESQTSTFYVDGQPTTVSAPGYLSLPFEAAHWIAIGGDPQVGTDGTVRCDQVIPGDVVMARIYDKPLSAAEVQKLWNEQNPAGTRTGMDGFATNLVQNVSMLSNVSAVAGGIYPIYGTGFQSTDEVTFSSNSSASKSRAKAAASQLSMTVENTRVLVTLPQDLVSGTYNVLLKRGDKTQLLGSVTFNVVSALRPLELIAHRGYHEGGAPENSMASLKGAQEKQFWGSETDVWLTSDNQLIVSHDGTTNRCTGNGTNLTISSSTFAQCRANRLQNGETMPSLEEFLTQVKNSSAATKLVIEIKYPDDDKAVTTAMKTVELVKSMGVQDKVEYISFSFNACKAVLDADPTAKVAYLNGDKYPEQILTESGDRRIISLDYHLTPMRNNPQWFAEAHDRSQTVNVWTINALSEAVEMANMGADYLTTNILPTELVRLKEYFDLNTK